MFRFPIMPEQASARAASYDALFYTISALTVFFTVAVGIMILFFVTKYRAGKKVDRRGALSHSTFLEMLWTVPPLFLAIGIFAWSAKNFIEFRQTPKNATEVFVIGKQWMWHVQHMNGIRENNELHVPVGKPVKLTMISQDVIHAMYLPEMRSQFHVVPGRYTELTFTPTKTGRFKMLCAMHCGTQHSEMVGQVYVMSQAEYAKWLEKGGNRYQPDALTMKEAGKQLFTQKGCANCHTGVDNPRAPSVNGIYNTKRTMTDGAVLTANDDYLRDSIVNPWRSVSAGYDLTMPSYKGSLTEEQVLQLVTYMKGLGVGEKGEYANPRNESKPSATGEANAASEANKRVSAGATQFSRAENK